MFVITTSIYEDILDKVFSYKKIEEGLTIEIKFNLWNAIRYGTYGGFNSIFCLIWGYSYDRF